MDNEERFNLITKDLAEYLTEDDLRSHIEVGMPLKHYIGYEISGRVHLGTGLMSGFKIADFQKAGVDCSNYLATWHAWINNKLGGDLDTIRRMAEYFKVGLEAGIEIGGGDVEKMRFISGDELYHNNDDFWLTTIEIAKNLSLKRVLRATTIMGRKEGESMPLAMLMYPPMQVADVFEQGINIAHAGMDQRKAQVIAREVADKLKIKPLEFEGKRYKPIAVHHPLIGGLKKPPIWPVPEGKRQEMLSELKMSKSVAGSAIFLDDDEETIRKTMKKAFCPEKIVEMNPILDWAKNIVFRKEGSVINIERPEKYGGNVDYIDYATLEKDFLSGDLHPADLKTGMAEFMVKFLEPARKRLHTEKFLKLREEIDSIKVKR